MRPVLYAWPYKSISVRVDAAAPPSSAATAGSRAANTDRLPWGICLRLNSSMSERNATPSALCILHLYRLVIQRLFSHTKQAHSLCSFAALSSVSIVGYSRIRICTYSLRPRPLAAFVAPQHFHRRRPDPTVSHRRLCSLSATQTSVC